MPFCEINTARYYYELHGDSSNKPLVLISGLWSDHNYWAPILSRLKNNFHLLVFDNRAIGQTTDDSADFSIDTMAEDTMSLIKNTLGTDSVNLVGQSMGAAIAQTIAAQYPDAIKKLVLLNSTPKWSRASVEGLRAILLSATEGVSFDVLFSQALAWLYGEAFLKDTSKVDCLRTTMLEAPTIQTLEDQKRQFFAVETFDGVDLSKIRSPTLVGYGLEDKITPSSEAESLASSITGAKLQRFNGAHRIISEALIELGSVLEEYFEVGLASTSSTETE